MNARGDERGVPANRRGPCLTNDRRSTRTVGAYTSLQLAVEGGECQRAEGGDNEQTAEAYESPLLTRGRGF
jgi:hypothetical protein